MSVSGNINSTASDALARSTSGNSRRETARDALLPDVLESASSNTCLASLPVTMDSTSVSSAAVSLCSWNRRFSACGVRDVPCHRWRACQHRRKREAAAVVIHDAQTSAKSKHRRMCHPMTRGITVKEIDIHRRERFASADCGTLNKRRTGELAEWFIHPRFISGAHQNPKRI